MRPTKRDGWMNGIKNLLNSQAGKTQSPQQTKCIVHQRVEWNVYHSGKHQLINIRENFKVAPKFFSDFK